MTLRAAIAGLAIQWLPLPLALGLHAQAVSIAPLAARADSLLRQGRFQQAAEAYQEILRRDTTQLDAVLGAARASLGGDRIDEAIRWYRRALEVGAGADNRIAYAIAQLHARRGERDSAVAWLERSLALRLEQRSRIAGDSAFARWRGDSVFRRLAGLAPREITDRVEGWRLDIDHLVAEARRMHAGPDRPAHQPAFAEAAEALKRRVGSLSDGRIVAELQGLLARLGDGHSILYPFPTPRVPLARVPLDLWQFSDGLVVVGAGEELAGRVGQRIVEVGGVQVAEALRRVTPYVSRDNPMGILVLGSLFLTFPAFVEAVGLGDGGAIRYTFADARGARETVTLAASGMRAPAFKLMPPAGHSGRQPRYLRRPDLNLWLEAMPEVRAVYVQYNQVRDDPARSVAAFADTLRGALARTGARHLIVDVRRNNGGNNELNRPLIRALVDFEMEPGRRIWVITSRTTFSACQNFINQVERMTGATFVGEPSGSRPNFAGEDTELVLPYSGLRGSISTRWWQDSGPLDRRQWIAPGLSVPVRSAEYFAGEDPVLEAVLAAIRAGAT